MQFFLCRRALALRTIDSFVNSSETPVEVSFICAVFLQPQGFVIQIVGGFVNFRDTSFGGDLLLPQRFGIQIVGGFVNVGDTSVGGDLHL